MHIDNWVRVGIIATVFSTAFSGWSAFRSEFPKSPQARNVPAPVNPATAPRTESAPSNIPFHFWLMIAPSVLSAGFLGLALLRASHRQKISPPRGTVSSNLKIHSAFYGVGNHADVEVTDKLRAAVGGDSLALQTK
jgi:hypothetical protein